MMLRIYASLKNVTEDELTAFESSLGHRLPEDYRQFLLKHNGGKSNLTAFKYKRREHLKLGEVRIFFGILENHDRDTVQRYISFFRDDSEISANWLPIGRGGAGNIVFLSVGGTDKGKVYYWLFETEPENERLFLIAESFAEFLEQLFERVEKPRESILPLKIYASLKNVTEDELTAFENSLGHRLPEDYRQFLLKHNGGFSNVSAFRYKEADYWQDGGVHRFLGISENHDRHSLQKHIALFQSYKETPPDLMPIADTGVGNFILLSIFGPDKGKVFYWNHEIDPVYGNIFFIAESFTKFLAKLFEWDDEDD